MMHVIFTPEEQIRKKKLKVDVFHLNNEPPFDLKDLAKKLNVSVDFRELKNDKISGWIERQQGDKFHIVINGNHPKKRQRFTLAHEIAHFVLHEHLIEDNVVDNVLYRSGLNNALEREANAYAAHILMPYPYLFDDVDTHVEQKGGLSKVISKEGLQNKSFSEFLTQKAEKYEVSEEAMAIRLGTEFGMWIRAKGA